MCGIAGIVGGGDVAGGLLAALARMEYRGYDSAGIAVVGESLRVHKALGCAADLEAALASDMPRGSTGIAHTRWATHGRPEIRNAHPHVAGGVAVVHNGIIENHAELRAELRSDGVGFASETDSEVIPALIARLMADGVGLTDAVRASCARLHGNYAIAAVSRSRPGLMVVARRGSPLVIARGDGRMAVSSDPGSLEGDFLEFAALEDGDVAEVTWSGAAIMDDAGGRAERPWREIRHEGNPSANVSRFRHHTRREISEQPDALLRTEAGLAGLRLPAQVAGATRVLVVACGSSFHAAATMRPFFERASGIPVELEVASEFRNREVPPVQGTVVVLVSQSGETADTISAMEGAALLGLPRIGIVNVPDSTIARGCDFVWPTSAGRETGVAATKTFTAQMLAFARLGVAIARARGRDGEADDLAGDLDRAPDACAAAECMEQRLAEVAHRVAGENEALFIGRGWGAALAQEGALKLKELSYVRADAYAAGELKHGPIALLREGSPVLVSAPGDRLLQKVASGVQEVRARGGHVTALADGASAAAMQEAADEVIVLKGRGAAAAFAHAVAWQLVSYHAAVALARNVDRPRNLAKSVTVG